MIDDTRIAFQTRRLAQALRATDDMTAVSKNKDGQHLILVTANGQDFEIRVAEGNALGSGHIDFVGNGVVYAYVSGQRVPDDIDSLIKTCERYDVDPFAYLRVRPFGSLRPAPKTFAQASTGDFDLEGILAHLRGE